MQDRIDANPTQESQGIPPITTLKPAQTRTCGDCTLCCKVLGVQSLKKPVNRWCPSCKNPGGCQIYDTRPQECQDFQCVWLQSDEAHVPSHWKPNKIGFVMATSKDGTTLAVYVNKGKETALRIPEVLRTFENMAAQGLDVVIMMPNGSALRFTHNPAQAAKVAAQLERGGGNTLRLKDRPYMVRPNGATPDTRVGTTEGPTP